MKSAVNIINNIMDSKKSHPKYKLEPSQEKQIEESWKYAKGLKVEEFLNVIIMKG